MSSTHLRLPCVCLLALAIHWVDDARAQSSLPRPLEPKAEQTSKPSPLDGKPALGMTPAVACLKVEGFEKFTVLPDASLTSADKLKVYFRPLHFKVETNTNLKSPYRAKFTEDGRIRRKGEKTVVAKEDKLLEYETRFDSPDYQIYLVNTIGLESLSPGEYEMDITLHDDIDGKVTATQTLAFRIVAGPVETASPKPEPETTKPAKTKRAGAGRSSKKPG